MATTNAKSRLLYKNVVLTTVSNVEELVVRALRVGPVPGQLTCSGTLGRGAATRLLCGLDSPFFHLQGRETLRQDVFRGVGHYRGLCDGQRLGRQAAQVFNWELGKKEQHRHLNTLKIL